MPRHIPNIDVDAGCELPDSPPKYTDNLCVLGLFEITATRQLSEESRYYRIKSRDTISRAAAEIPEGATLNFVGSMFGLTLPGSSFRDACITEKGVHNIFMSL